MLFKKIASYFHGAAEAREEKKEAKVEADKLSRLHFIEGELSALLSKIDPTIEVAERLQRGSTEYVRVHYSGGSYCDINVTGDSLGLMAIDVIERII